MISGHWYRGANWHVRYWLGHVLPVITVMYDDEDRVIYWPDLTGHRIDYNTDSGWKILVSAFRLPASAPTSTPLPDLRPRRHPVSPDDDVNDLARNDDESVGLLARQRPG